MYRKYKDFFMIRRVLPVIAAALLLAACSKETPRPEERFTGDVAVEFRLCETSPAPRLVMMAPEAFSDTLYVHPEPLMTHADFDSVVSRRMRRVRNFSVGSDMKS